MDDVVRTLHQFVDSNRAQMRAEHVHDNRLLTEHYLREIASVESTLMELQSVREQEIEQAQNDVDELEEQVEELEEEKRDWEEEKQDWEEEKERLERRVRELEAERLIFTHNEEWSENRIDELEQEVQDLEQEKEDWEEDKEGVEEEREGLETEKADLEEQNAYLERQVLMWKSRYEQTFAEKVAVESQYGDPPRLPLELMANIMAFAAGSNRFGTLATLCRTSKLMSQECTPYLYETVILTAGMQKILGDRVTARLPVAWKHVKFVITDLASAALITPTVFPNLRAVLLKRRTSKRQYISSAEARSRHTIQLVLWKTMTANTLDSILGCPLIWPYMGNYNAVDHTRAVTVLDHIRGITTITLHPDAHLLPGQAPSRCRFAPTQGGLAIVDIKHTNADEKTHASIREICRFVSPKRSRIGPDQIKALRKELLIKLMDPAQIQFWLHELPPVLRLEPTLGLNFVLADKVEERVLLQHVTSLTRLYESVWPHMRTGRSDARQPAPAEFFSLRTLVRPDPGRALECPYIVTFTTSPPMDQFRVLVLHNTTVAGDDVPIVLLEEDYPRPQPQPQPQPPAESDERMEVNVEENEADDDSDGSSLTALSDDEEVWMYI